MQRVADRLEIAIGTLYRAWGGRLMCLERTWRHVMAVLDGDLDLVRNRLSPNCHCLDEIWETIECRLPVQIEAFVELHSARARWMRGFQEPDAVLTPGLIGFVDEAQRLGHIRMGPAPLYAALIWWLVMGAVSGAVKDDLQRRHYCRGALKRMLLTPAALVGDDDGIELDVDSGGLGLANDYRPVRLVESGPRPRRPMPRHPMDDDLPRMMTGDARPVAQVSA